MLCWGHPTLLLPFCNEYWDGESIWMLDDESRQVVKGMNAQWSKEVVLIPFFPTDYLRTLTVLHSPMHHAPWRQPFSSHASTSQLGGPNVGGELKTRKLTLQTNSPRSPANGSNRSSARTYSLAHRRRHIVQFIPKSLLLSFSLDLQS